jgi:formylglycine-generating enzyme required for sulfatase activity
MKNSAIVLLLFLFSSFKADTTIFSSLSPADRERMILQIAFNMVSIEGGTFTMGCTPEQGGDCTFIEKPVHQVTLNNFSISKYEVTQSQWRAVMGANPSYFKNCDTCPVEQVSWNDIKTFLSKLNALTGMNYRLPTEAEWEYAARGGNRSGGYKYSGSNAVGAVAWNADNSKDKTHPVGKKSPNNLGLYDMSGNVWEWCYDWYGIYDKRPQNNPIGPAIGVSRVERGGGWSTKARYTRLSFRNGNTPDNRNILVGFRLAL